MQKIIKQKAEEMVSDSSFIRRIIYFIKTEELMIFIKDKIYLYKGVEYERYYELKDSESKGSYYNTKIKNAYNYEKY